MRHESATAGGSGHERRTLSDREMGPPRRPFAHQSPGDDRCHRRHPRRHARRRRGAGSLPAPTPAAMRAAVAGLDDGQLDTPYRDGGWTLRQVVHHVPDSHGNALFRFKLALTEDNPTIKPYDEARWAELEDARSTPIETSLT